ncbi:MAG: outer membrane beta-barrel protein [Pseudomonadota bacterium]
MSIAGKIFTAVLASACVLSLTPLSTAQTVELSDRYSTSFKPPNQPAKSTLNGFDLRSSLRLSLGYDDNIYQTQRNERNSAFLKANLFSSARKNGDFYKTYTSLLGSTRHYPTNDEADEIYFRAFNFTKVDLGNDAQVELVTKYVYDEEAREDDRAPLNFVQDVADQFISSKIYLSRVFGEYGLTVSGGIQRELNENTFLNNGSFFERSDANHNLLEVAARASRKYSKEFEPFIELGYVNWIFDDSLDRNGIERGSEGFHAAIGSYFEIDDVKGEFAIGYRNHRFPAQQFEDLEALTFDAWIDWKLGENTSIILVAGTSFEEETVSSRAGTLTRSAEAGVYHYLTEMFRIHASSRYEFEESVSGPFDDYSLTHKFGMDYELQPGVVGSLEYKYKEFDDGAEANSYTSNQIVASIKFVR